MDVEIVRSVADLDALREEWEDLQRRDPQSSFYLSHRFVSAWCHAYADDPEVELHILCVRHNGTLVAAMPLSLRQGVRKGRPVTTLKVATHGDYLGALVDPTSALDATCRALTGAMDRPDQWDSISLTGIPAQSHLGRFFLKTEHNPRFVHQVEAPHIDLREYADFADFCARSLPGHTRKYRNKLFRDHEVRFGVHAGNEGGILDRIASVHRAERDYLVERKARTERHSLYDDPRRTAHIRAVFDGGDDLAVTFTYENAAGEVIAYRTCFRQGRTLLSWNSAYLPAYDTYRLGKVIQYGILEHLFHEGSTDIFDFGAGRYPWKFEWTSLFTPTYRYRRQLNLDPPAARRAEVPEPAAPPVELPADRSPEPPAPEAPSPGPWQQARRAAHRAAGRAGLGRLRRGVLGQVTSARGRRQPPVIWYVPHPDDETIFMGGSIAHHRHRRNILVVLTEGGGSAVLPKVNARLEHPLTATGFTQGRLTELSGALAALGVDPRQVRQHQLTDGALTVSEVHAVITEMAGGFPGATHRTMSYLDPHRDHRTAGRALRQAHQEGVVQDCVFHLPIPLVPDTWGVRAPLSVSDVEVKRAALREYQRWDPGQGRYAIGGFSVGSLIETQLARPHERVHDAAYDA